MQQYHGCSNTRWGSYATAGIFLGLGFIWPVLWVLVFPGIAIFLSALAKTQSVFQAWIGGCVTFTLKMLLSVGWFWTTYPIDWIDFGLGSYEPLVIGFYWLLIGFAVGLSGGFLACAGILARRFLPRWWLIAVCVLWVPSEISGAFLFSLVTYGDGSSLNTLFSFGMAGYHLAEHPWFLQLARLGGVYSLSIMAVVMGTLIYETRHSLQQPKYQYVLLGGLMVLALTASLRLPLNEQPLTESVAIINTKFGGADYFLHPNRAEKRQSALGEALTVAQGVGAEYILLPEDSRFMPPALSPAQANRVYRQEYDNPRTVVLEVGRVPTTLRESALRATVYDGVTGLGYGLDKQYLVAQGEYVPYITSFTLRMFGFGRSVAPLTERLSYRPGPYKTQENFPTHVPGVLFCFENIDPLSVRKLNSERTLPFVAHPISHAWFHNPESLWQQLDAMLKIHAVWNQVDIISAGNMVEGRRYTPAGTVVMPNIIERGEYWEVGLF